MSYYVHIATSDLTPGSIVALSIVKDKGELELYREFSPGKDIISAGATSVHGLTNEHLKDKETFTESFVKIFDKFVTHGSQLFVYNKKFFCDFFIKHLNETNLSENDRIKYMVYLKNNVFDVMTMFAESKSSNRLVAQRKQNISLDTAFGMVMLSTFKTKTDLTAVEIKNRINNPTIYKAYQIYLIHQFLLNKNIALLINRVKNNIRKLNLTQAKQCRCNIIFNNDKKKNKYDFILRIFMEKENLKLYGYKLRDENKYSVIQYKGENKDDKIKGTAVINNNEIDIQLGDKRFLLNNLSFNTKEPLKITTIGSSTKGDTVRSSVQDDTVRSSAKDDTVGLSSTSDATVKSTNTSEDSVEDKGRNKTVLVLHHTNTYNPFFWGILNAFVKKGEELIPVQKNIYAVFKEYELDEYLNKKDNNIQLELVSKDEPDRKFGILELDFHTNKIYYYPTGSMTEHLFVGDYNYSFKGNITEDINLNKNLNNNSNNNSNTNSSKEHSDVSIAVKDDLIHIVLH